MDLDRATDFLSSHHRAVLATFRADGRPQLSPVLCAVDDDGRVLISTRETAIKAKNARRNPQAALCVFSDGFFGDWSRLKGRRRSSRCPAPWNSSLITTAALPA